MIGPLWTWQNLLVMLAIAWAIVHVARQAIQAIHSAWSTAMPDSKTGCAGGCQGCAASGSGRSAHGESLISVESLVRVQSPAPDESLVPVKSRRSDR